MDELSSLEQQALDRPVVATSTIADVEPTRTVWQPAFVWEHLRRVRPRWNSHTKAIALSAVELCIIIFWGLFFARKYLNLDPQMAPTGREYLAAIQTHYIWTQMRTCGWCGWWFGNVSGGYPAVVDPISSLLHPIVMITTLVWGVLNGSKVALALAFIMAGLAQWWLARVLKLGRIACVWSGCMAVVAGNLAGRMEQGAFGVIFSTAACALVLPPLLWLSQTGRRRAAVLLGVTLSLAALSGNGYMQVCLLWTLPAVVLLWPRERQQLAQLMRRYLLAGAIAFLLAAPMLVPFIHFIPNFDKDFDLTFEGAQPLVFVPLNLVINNTDFYLNNVLDKKPNPSHYINFVGWIPILLAVCALWGHRNIKERQAARYLLATAFLALLVASAVPLRWIVAVAPEAVARFLAGTRFTAFMAGLAVPPILGLSAIGLNRLLTTPWPRFQFAFAPAEASAESQNGLVSFDLRWLLVIPLVYALVVAQTFSSQWISMEPLSPIVAPVLAAVHTQDLQWIDLPLGEQFFVDSAVQQNFKLSFDTFRTWHWRDRTRPEPILAASRGDPGPDMTAQKKIEDVVVYAGPPGREYAAVTDADGTRTVCTARGVGGNIDVNCDAPHDGLLTVEENYWSGWNAWVDGQATRLKRKDWLQVDLPAGKHSIQFRYLPWDVPVGLLLCLCGIGLVVYEWRRSDQSAASSRQSTDMRREGSGVSVLSSRSPTPPYSPDSAPADP